MNRTKFRRPIEYIPAEAYMTEPADNEPYTKIPNWIFDAMPEMSNTELRIIMAVARQTIGWHQAWAIISIKDFRLLTKLSKQGVLDGIESAIAHGYVERQGGQKNRSYGYRLCCKVVYSVDNLRDVKPVDMSTQQTTNGLLSRQQDVKPVDNFNADLPQQKAANDVPKEKKESIKKRESATHSTRSQDKPFDQSRLNWVHEHVQIVKQYFGKQTKLTPAQQDLIVEKQLETARWDRNVKAYAQKYSRVNVPAMLDWYDRDDAGKQQTQQRQNGTHTGDYSAVEKARREREEIEREWAQQQGGAR